MAASRAAAFHLVVASDGSPTARAAAATALAFPWPAGTRAHAVIARPVWGTVGRTAPVEHALERVGADVGRTLRRRWPGATTAIVDGAPVDDVIVREAKRLRANAIVVGWRGFGTFRRLLQGSVSRRVVRHAPCAVLVVRRRRRHIRSLVIALDGSVNARRAAEFVAGLTPQADGRATLVRVVNPAMVPSPAFFPPAALARLSKELGALHDEDVARAQRDLDRAATRLTRAGWKVQTEVPAGEPLHEVLAAAQRARADLLVVGAQGATELKRILLGSVAEGVLDRSRVPVLVVR